MFTQGFGEVITDILTINPILRSIPSASAILDTSNYTFNAVTFGKDAEGFSRHAHSLSSFVLGEFNEGYVLMMRYNTDSPSSYHSSATHSYYSSITLSPLSPTPILLPAYNSIPQYPSVYDTRLESKSTETPAEIYIKSISPIFESYIKNLGHYTNASIDSVWSSIWNVIGGFPPSGNAAKYKIIDSSGAFVTSGNLSGVFNSNGVMDTSGYLKINEINASTVTTSFASGPYISVDLPTFSANPDLRIVIAIQLGDAASLAAFGGLNHFGIYCLDIKAMVRAGLRPPYAWNHLNNSRKYKLVAKATFWRDLLHHIDAAGILPGYKTLLVDGLNQTGVLGPAFILNINF